MKQKIFLTRSAAVISISALFALPVLLLPAKETAFAEETTEKIYCDATLEDEFSSDRVLVVLKESVSSEAKSYSANNFSEISCQSIKDLTETATQTFMRNRR